MKVFKLKISFVVLFLLSFTANASHIGGGNISYTCTGNPNEYLITLTLYRDCNGVSAPNSPSVDFSNSCGLANPNSLTLTQDSTSEISNLCTSEIPNSVCNGGALIGYQIYIYKGTVTFSGPCDSWIISYDICNRNAATNLTGGSGNCFYVESHIYSNTNSCNNSPTISSEYPVPSVCVNQPSTLDLGIAEPDGNTLQFSFVNAMDASGTPIVYNAGYSSSAPIQGITIDPVTGQLSFTPVLGGNFVITILIQEFDGSGNLVGSIMHDTQIIVDNTCFNSTSSSPGSAGNFQNSGSNTTFTNGNTISMCDGDQFCIDVVFSDPDAGDVLTLTTNATTLLPGATFTQTGTNPATGTLCWTYQSGYLGNLISITSNDNACPTPAVSSFILNLDIPPPLNVSPNDTICGNQVANLQALGAPPLTWSVIYGDPMVVGTNFSCNNCTNPDATPAVTTAYQIEDGSVCQLRDTIVVTVVQNEGNILANIVTNDTSICAGQCFNIDAEAIETFSGTTQSTFQTSSVVNIIDNQTVTSTISVSGLNMSSLSAGSIESVCLDITHTWDSDLDLYLVCPDGTQFLLSNSNGGSSDNYTNTCFTISATQSITSGSAPFSGNFVPEGGLLSGALIGCSSNGTWTLSVEDGAGGDQGTINNWSITFNDEIPNQGPATSINWSNTNGIVDPNSPTSQICPTVSGEYILYAYDLDNCWDSDTFNIVINNPLFAGLDSAINICKESNQIDLFNAIGGTPDVGGLWINSSFDTISQNILADTITSGSVFGYLIGIPPCTDTAFVTVNVFEVSATAVVDNSDCNACNGSVTVTPSGFYGSINDVTYVNNGGTPQSSNIFNSLCGGVPGTPYTIVITDSIGCQKVLTETVIDENFPVITDTNTINNICNGGFNGQIEVIGDNLNFYSIDGGATSQSSNVFNNLPAGTYSVIAYSSDPTTTNACQDEIYNITITEPDALDVYDITPDVIICPNDEITVSVSQHGGLGNTVLTWSVNGVVEDTGDSYTFTPSVVSQVCVTISENSCLTDTECMDITFPTPIVPSFTADTTNGCFPVNVVFTNTSTNQTDIQSVYWNFENAGTGSGNSTTMASFNDPGLYDISMQITSVHGCIYDTTYSDFIEAFDFPRANFTSVPKPLTIYETQVHFNDLSTDDVVDWSWDMGQGASPRFSNEQNPQAVYPEGIPAIYPVTLIVNNEHQCFDTLIGQVEVINDVIVYAPNVFTPDNDDFNESWRIYISGIDIYDYHLILFNRWGEIIWESYNPEASWKGKYGDSDDVKDGTYVWVLNAKDTFNDKKYEFRGTVTVLR